MNNIHKLFQTPSTMLCMTTDYNRQTPLHDFAIEEFNRSPHSIVPTLTLLSSTTAHHLSFLNSVIILDKYNTTKYCLKLSNNHSCTDDISQLFFKSLLDSKILTGSSVNSSYSSISFYASSVVKLKDWLLSGGGSGGSGRMEGNGWSHRDQQFSDYTPERQQRSMSYNSAIHLVYSLSKQQKYLENNKLGFVCFNVDDIVVIDDSKFICVNPSLCEELFWLPPKEFNHSPSTHCAVSTARNTSSGKMTLCRPFNRAHCFCSPELLRIDSLPASVHHKTSYYSLGLLAIFCLFGYDDRCCSDSQQVYVSLQPILNTKLYFYLLRCLSVHAENRHLFFV